jgi:hypothetical protein
MFWKQRKEEKSFFMLVPVILERLKGEKEILKDVSLRCVACLSRYLLIYTKEPLKNMVHGMAKGERKRER